MRTESRSKSNMPLQLAAVLLCLTLFSIYFVSGLYARYTYKETNNNSAKSLWEQF